MRTLYDEYREKLADFVKISSISMDKKYEEELEAAAEWIEELLDNKGLSVDVVEGYGNPIIIADYQVSNSADTYLIYGHYDVQPASQEAGWLDNPFKLTESQDRLIARGVVDNKGQILLYLTVIFDLIKHGKLRHNIKFLIEGGEEVGSPNIDKFIEKYKDTLSSDCILISDGAMLGDHPILEVGFRGTLNVHLILKTAETDMHSGEYGGAIPNAAHELTTLLSKLYLKNRQINIQGFYDDVQSVKPQFAQQQKSVRYSVGELRKSTGVKEILTEPNLSIFSQTGMRPSIEATSLKSGYLEEGFKNAIPSRADAKLNIRLVPAQKPERVVTLLKRFIETKLPSYVEYQLLSTESDHNEPIVINIDNDYAKKAKRLLKEVYKNQVIEHYVGGTLPIVKYFQDLLKIPQLSIPLANQDCRMHGVNENFEIKKIIKGLEFIKQFLI